MSMVISETHLNVDVFRGKTNRAEKTLANSYW
jgi:hypothetical protein